MTHNVTSVKLSIKFAQFNWNNFSSNFKSYNKLQAYEIRQLRMLLNIVEKMQSNIHLTIDDNSSGTFAVQN